MSSTAQGRAVRTNEPFCIGSRWYPHSLEKRSDADGSYSYRMPPATDDAELLQTALLRTPEPAAPHRGDRWVGIVGYSAMAGIVLAYLIAQVTA